MIDYRPIVVQYIKDILNDIPVRDGSKNPKQPSGDYVTYFILDESKGSFVNNTGRELNQADPTLIDYTHTPLTIATLNLDIRGENSFINARNLRNSFDTITNKKLLSSQGVSFMSIGNISTLPQVKNTKNEEGYIFDLIFSYDNTHIDQVPLAEQVNLTARNQIKE